MGSSSQSPPQQTTSTTTTELPDFVQAPAERYLSRAEDLSTQPFSAYEGERVAPLNTFHQAALDGGRQAIGTMLPGGMNVMNQFAQGAYNSPAYIHPFLGPQLPGAGFIPTGYTGNPGGDYQGYTPLPQPGPPVNTGGAGGKGGAIAPPQPVPLAPIPDDISLINVPPDLSGGTMTPGQAANPGGYVAPTQQALADAGYSEDVGIHTPYYTDFGDFISNTAFGLPTGLGYMAHGLLTDAPPPAMWAGPDFSYNHDAFQAFDGAPAFSFGDIGQPGIDSDIGLGY